MGAAGGGGCDGKERRGMRWRKWLVWVLAVCVVGCLVFLVWLVFGMSWCGGVWTAMTSGRSQVFNLVSFLASAVTIFGVIGVVYHYFRIRVSRKCQEMILLDLVRHVFVNCAIIEIIRVKLAQDRGCRPADGVLQRFAFLDNDMDLGRFSVTSANFDKIHSACLSMRNYNVSAMVAERHNADGSCSCEQRIADLDELFDRGVAVTKKLIGLAEKMRLNVKVGMIRSRSGVEQKDGMYRFCICYEDIPERRRFKNHSYYDDNGLGDLLDRNIVARASTFGFVRTDGDGGRGEQKRRWPRCVTDILFNFTK